MMNVKEETITSYMNKEEKQKPLDAVGFDPLLDVCLWSESVKYEKYSVTLSVMQYNQGMKKLSIGKTTPDGKYMKPGRFTKEEALQIFQMLGKALAYL